MAAVAHTSAGKQANANAITVRCILLVAPSPPPYGGMALQARQLEKRLALDGNSVIFFPSNFALPRLFRPLDRVPGVRTLLRAALIWILLWRKMKSAEVVHILAASWLYFFVVVCPSVIVGRMRGKRVVLNYRGGEAEQFFQQYGWAAKRVVGLAHVVTAPSEFLAGVIRQYLGIPVTIVSNIVDTRIFRYRERSVLQPRMVVARHLEEIYDIESVLRAFRDVQKRHEEAALWVAGTGSQGDRLRSLVAEWGLRNVRFLGGVPHEQLPAIYEQCDILLNASRVDNFPGALVEASAAGLAVVSTWAGGIPFIYENGVSALLVTPGDWRGLADGVERVLQDHILAAFLTSQAFSIARRCDWEVVRESLYETYGDQKGD